MKKDIVDRQDIKTLIDAFYDKVRQDEVIGYIFNDVAKVDWPHHLPIMYDFWEMVLFGKGPYKGDPMTKHIQLNQKTKLDSTHFATWTKLFFDTLDENFEGAKADEAKRRAGNIASLMEYKVQQSN